MILSPAGSGQLDTYRKRGDSQAGRYALFRMRPLTLAELSSTRTHPDRLLGPPLAVKTDRDGEGGRAWRCLGRFTGFPEPYGRARERSYRRWSTAYADQLIRGDVRDLTAIRSIGDLETLKKIQTMLGVPAVQVLDQGETFRKLKSGGQAILVSPAPLWIPRLP